MLLKIQQIKLAFILTTATSLVACGGGDSDGGTENPTPRALMTIDSNNAEFTSGVVYDGLASQQNSSVSTISAGSPETTTANQSINKVIQNVQALKNTDNQDSIVSSVFTAGTVQCNGGGTITTTSNSISYNNCRENYLDGSYDITSGTATISNLQQTGDETTCTARLSATFIFDNLNDREFDMNNTLIGNTSINGSMRLSSTQAFVNSVCTTTYSNTSDYLSLKSNNDYISFFNYSISGTTDTNFNYAASYNATLDSSVLPGSLIIETLSPFTGVETDPYPTSGHIRYTANSPTPGVPAIVDINIDNGVVTLTVDADGTPGTDPGYPKTMTWSEFEAL